MLKEVSLPGGESACDSSNHVTVCPARRRQPHRRNARNEPKTTAAAPFRVTIRRTQYRLAQVTMVLPGRFSVSDGLDLFNHLYGDDVFAD